MKQCVVYLWVAVVFTAIPVALSAQNSPSFTRNGDINSNNNISFSATTAGQNPMDLTTFNRDNSNTNNTRMNVKYKWPFWGTDEQENTYLYGYVRVVSSIQVPSGLSWQITAPVPGSNYGQYGTSTGAQELSMTKVTLIDGIWSTSSGWFPFIGWLASTITSTLTQQLSVTNFADIHPTPNGNFQTIVLTFTLE